MEPTVFYPFQATGLPPWAGPAEPGPVHDITAAPGRATLITSAALALTQHEHKYIS